MANNKTSMLTRKSNFIFPLPIIIVIMFLILFFWAKKEDSGIVSISIFILCFFGFFCKKGLEINNNQYSAYTQFLFFKKINKIEIYEEGIKELFLNKMNEKIMIESSFSRGGRGYFNVVKNCNYVLIINTHLDRKVIVLKSKDYSYIEKYAKLFSKYYNLPINENDINIEYPSTGNLVEHSKTSKPRITIKKVTSSLHKNGNVSD